MLEVEHGTKVTYLENLSTIVNTASKPLDNGRWVIKSIIIYSNGLEGGSKGSNNPRGSNAKMQPNISLSVADHLLSTSDKRLEKCSIGCHSLSTSYSKITPVVKPEVLTRTLLGKVGSKILRTGA